MRDKRSGVGAVCCSRYHGSRAMILQGLPRSQFTTIFILISTRPIESTLTNDQFIFRRLSPRQCSRPSLSHIDFTLRRCGGAPAALQ
jgi:hypothetical protein